MRVLLIPLLCALTSACAQPQATRTNLATPHADTASASSSSFAGALPNPLSLGKEFSCAIAKDETVRCWGRNDTFQLGADKELPFIVKPTAVTNVANATSVASGGNHACALRTDGSVVCWGRDDSIAGPNAVTRKTATQMKGASGIRSVVAGDRHDCILTSERTVKCIGWGSDGQLGNGGQQASSALSDVVLLKDVDSISSGQLHSCALLRNGNAMCWGSGRYGRLGNAATNQYTFAMTPVDVVGMGDKVVQLSMGGDRSCALTSRGGVKCWGRIRPGRVLNEHEIADYAATPLEVSHLSTGVKQIATGGNHACALLNEGIVTCWGWNENGQLGNGSTSDTEEPARVTGLRDVVAIRTGDRHSCALLSSGKIKCWGANNFGQLGNGTTSDSSIPVDVVDF